MKKINHNILPTLQMWGIVSIVLFSLFIGGKIDCQQDKESEALNAQIIRQSRIDSAIYYINSNANLGTDADLQDKINEASIIYSLDSLQIATLESEYYL